MNCVHPATAAPARPPVRLRRPAGRILRQNPQSSLAKRRERRRIITMGNSLMARVKDGTVEAKEAYMKGSNKALFAPLLKPGDLDPGAGH